MNVTQPLGSVDIASPPWPRKRARQVMGATLALGAVTYPLFWDTRIGAGFLVLMVVLTTSVLVTFGRAEGRRPSAASCLCAVGCVLAAAAPVAHASGWSLAFGVPTSLVLLGILPLLACHRATFRDLERFGEFAWNTLSLTPTALREASRIPSEAIQATRQVGSVVRGVLLGLPITFVFALLLSGDARFASEAGRLVGHLGTAGRAVLLTLLSTAGYLFVYGLFRRRAVPEALGATPGGPYRLPGGDVEPSEPEKPTARRVLPLTWSMVLGQVTLAFGLFVAVNGRSLFSGHTIIRAKGTVTYAEHLHRGFAELLAATVLTVVLITAGHHLLRPRGVANAKVPGGRALALLETLLLASSTVVLFSCWERLHVYEVAYGYTHLRLAVTFVLLGCLGLLAITGVRSWTRGTRHWTTATGILTMSCLLAASWFDADLYIARGNVERAQASLNGSADPLAWRVLDRELLFRMSTDARPILKHRFFESEPELAVGLESKWGHEAEVREAGGWRARRGVLAP